MLGTFSGTHRKTLDNNDLNQVMRPAVLVKTRIWLGVQSRMLKKTWGPFLESPGNFSGPKSNIQIEI